MTPTARDIELLKQHNKKIRMRIKLLDSETYTEIDSITGYVVSSSFSKNYDSDIRNTCPLTLAVPSKDQIYIDFDKLWNKSMVEVICGIYDKKNNNYKEYNLGRLLMESGSTTYNATTQEINLNLVDLMASMTEERGSQVGSGTYIPTSEQGTNIRNILIAIVTTFSDFKQYSIPEFEDTLPYDLNFESGIYPIEMLKKVLGLFPYYEMFYNENGVFTVQKIPTKINDPVDISADILDELLISESKTNDFSEIKNTTEIWGRDLTCDYAAVSCEAEGDVYEVTISDTFTALVDGETYAVYPLVDSVAGQKMDIQELGEYGIYNVSGSGTYTAIEAGEMQANTPYSIRYTDEKYVLVGELQVRCIVQEVTEMPSSAAQTYYKTQNNCNNVQWVVNPDSQYACTLSPTTGRIQGEIKQVLDGDEYSGIYTTQLALERARLENWKKCRLQDTVTIEAILIPWLDVNQKIQYHSLATGDLGTWITQSVDFDFENWTMTVGASRFYPYYPWENEEIEEDEEVAADI